MSMTNIAVIVNANKELQDKVIKRFEETDVMEGNNVWVMAKRLELHNLLLEVSKEQEGTIKVSHSFSVERYIKTYITEYSKGNYEVVEIKINHNS
ncbi:MAG: hypothetical protein ACOYJ1_13215 [Peptococcales bacterium]|jgi:putative lipoic acid-binding regulatory protein